MDQLHFFPAQWDLGYKDNWAVEVTRETKPCVCARASGAAFILGAVTSQAEVLALVRQQQFPTGCRHSSQRDAEPRAARDGEGDPVPAMGLLWGLQGR